MAQTENAQHGFSAFLQLERIARRAEDEEALAFTMVNETRRLIPYRQAALIDLGRAASPRVAAVSGVPAPDRDAPMIRWLTALARKIDPAAPPDAAMTLTPETAPPGLADDWPQFVGQQAIWRPLNARRGWSMTGCCSTGFATHTPMRGARWRRPSASGAGACRARRRRPCWRRWRLAY